LPLSFLVAPVAGLFLCLLAWPPPFPSKAPSVQGHLVSSNFTCPRSPLIWRPCTSFFPIPFDFFSGRRTVTSYDIAVSVATSFIVNVPHSLRSLPFSEEALSVLPPLILSATANFAQGTPVSSPPSHLPDTLVFLRD